MAATTVTPKVFPVHDVGALEEELGRELDDLEASSLERWQLCGFTEVEIIIAGHGRRTILPVRAGGPSRKRTDRPASAAYVAAFLTRAVGPLGGDAAKLLRSQCVRRQRVERRPRARGAGAPAVRPASSRRSSERSGDSGEDGEPERACGHCGSDISHLARQARYCGDAHRKAAARVELALRAEALAAARQSARGARERPGLLDVELADAWQDLRAARASASQRPPCRCSAPIPVAEAEALACIACGRWVEGPHGRVDPPGCAPLVSRWDLEQRDVLPARRDRLTRDWRLVPDRALAAKLRSTRRNYTSAEAGA
jgi:hypothetical protein